MPDLTPSILVRGRGADQWSTPETSAYDDESHLQSLLAGDPGRIPGVPDDAVAVRELSTMAGFIDVCVVGRDGSITVVECKLARNSEKRRMVVGQVIDYAAALRAGGVKAFRDGWAARQGADLDELLDQDAVVALEHNLVEGRMNLCLAVDQIDADLRRLIEYLNVVTRDEVMVTALQLSYAKHGDLEILIPATFGAELAEAKAPQRHGGERWTWESFVETLRDPADKELAAELLARMDAVASTGPRSKLWFGARPGGGVFFHIHGERYAAFQLWQNSAHQLRVFGNWHAWNNLAGHDAFAPLAEVLGQDHHGGSRSVALAQVDLDTFWSAAVACDRAINGL
jgi:hypothetical protein